LNSTLIPNWAALTPLVVEAAFPIQLDTYYGRTIPQVAASSYLAGRAKPVLQRLASLVFLFLPWFLCAQTAKVKPPDIKGHFIGESVMELLSKEPEVQQKVSICERNPQKTDCDWLLAAVQSGERATVSTSNWMDFVLDGGRLVKLQTLAHGEFGEVNADLTKKFGSRSSETAFSMHNAIGQQWEDRLYVWDTPTLYVGLHEDNNPASQNHHLILVVESRAEHDRDTDRAQQPRAKNEN